MADLHRRVEVLHSKRPVARLRGDMGRGWRRHEWSQPVEGVRLNGINGLDVEALKAFAAQILPNPDQIGAIERTPYLTPRGVLTLNR